MNSELEQVLREIELDMKPGVAGRFLQVAENYFSRSANTDRPVSGRTPPDQLLARLPAIQAEPRTVSDVLAAIEKIVVEESNWLYHPRYMGHQVTAPLPVAVWAEPIIGALNQSVAVQEMSPAITVLEKQIVSWMTGLAGLGTSAGGTLTSGGTEANFTALLAARARALPDSWENGVTGWLPVVLCGEHAHYAITRATAQLGLGLKRAVLVKSDGYRMDAADLAAKLAALEQQGTRVMAVVATAGSTATGSFDDLNAIADSCDRHGVWLHVDGAHGASALLSARRRGLLNGVERARSIAWDPHKMMLMPLSVGVVLVRDASDLDAAFRQQAPYLFQDKSQEQSWDQGGRSFQCSRRGDALKLWAALQRYGTTAFGLLYDRFCDLAMELHALLEANGGFELLHEPDCNILCFRFIGDASATDEQLDALNLALRRAYNTTGTGWITSTVLNGRRVLRTTLMNPRIRTDHLQQLVAELKTTGFRLQKAT